MITPIYKPYGASTHQLAQRYGSIVGEKASHTGTLDPAAEGIVTVVTGDDRFRKSELSSVTKVYRAEILIGISTDTHDLIGLPTSYDSTAKTANTLLKNSLSSLEGSYEQRLPAFSAKRVEGKSSFNLAKEGRVLTSSSPISISSNRLLSQEYVSVTQLEQYHTAHLHRISGDFRQDEIRHSWMTLFQELHSLNNLQLQLITIEITCSKRTYIRALVRDLSQLLQVPAVLYSLVRTQNGDYSIKDCLCLV